MTIKSHGIRLHFAGGKCYAAVWRAHQKRAGYVVDIFEENGVYRFPTLKQAEQWIEKNRKQNANK